jgi:hypothetical protein
MASAYDCCSIFVIYFGRGIATWHHLGGAGGNTNRTPLLSIHGIFRRPLPRPYAEDNRCPCFGGDVDVEFGEYHQQHD